MNSIASVTIWYNPQNMTSPTAAEAVNTYASHMGKAYIVDNSDTDNSELAALIPNSVYIPNHKNLGIATALNQGCESAKKDGFEWCMTMDQDSYFSQEQLIKYLSFFKDNFLLDSSIKSFAPSQNEIGKNILPFSTKIRKRFLSPIKHLIFKKTQNNNSITISDKIFVDRIMTSANIIHLNTWAEIGKFDDILFIDEVDHDFCIRLILSNFKILKSNTCFVNHTLGQTKRTFFPKVQYESDFRLFYIFRNIMIEKNRFGKINKARNYSKELWEYFRDYCILDLHFFTHLCIFIKAYKNYKIIIHNGLENKYEKK